MKSLRTFAAVLVMVFAGTTQAQDISWNRDKYPDYNPIPHVDNEQVAKMQRRINARRAAGQERPDHWNNGTSTAFPPVMNQSAGSCGSASRIYYMFAHELNAARFANGKLSENIYPTHFTWLLTWVSNQGKEIIAQHNGVPNSAVYGGYTYSDLFGYQDCDDGTSIYGWMQGYDKWFHAMHNRITGSANFPKSVQSEEGRELVKNYLWNHCGDDSYSTGGIVGIGVASGGNWQKIPKTATNDAIGVTNMYYVADWGGSVDHALTIVGYDDRIEFDLDGNGVKGEKDKDEVGAWIVVNSWGAGWCNNGFIYCPYGRATPSNSRTGYYQPEYYTPRRDYRPLRTLKVRMDYSHRSEIALYVGVAQNLNATKPEKETWLRHFYYSGLGKGATANPAPAVPMLGRWADGVLHTEPMEFGYDLTDLVDGFDPSRPLKYFFWVEPKSWAVGEGHIYSASVIDYTLDRDGVEVPFEIAEGGVAVANAGKKTMVTAIGRSESVAAPRNLTLADNLLKWDAPAAVSYDVKAYNIYKDNDLFKSVDGKTQSAQVGGEGSFAVTATYDINGYEVESPKSAALANFSAVNATNTVLQIEKGGEITIPKVTNGTLNAYTLEFYMYPNTALKDNTFGIKASSGKFFTKINGSKYLEMGFDGGDYTTVNKAITVRTWTHVAFVVNGTNMTCYINGTRATSWTSGYSNSGIAGNNDLIIGHTEGTSNNYKNVISAPWVGQIDEVRFWNYARSASEIKSAYQETFVFPLLQSGLTHYYKMNPADGKLVNAMGTNHASFSDPSLFSYVEVEPNTKYDPLKPKASADFEFATEDVVVGVPVKFIDKSSPSTVAWNWTVSGSESSQLQVSQPIVVFNKVGEQTVSLTTTNLDGTTAEISKTINVQAAAKPVADFAVPSGEIAAGEHITFVNTSSPIDECTYQWSLEGADIEDVRTTNAAATYGNYGTYTVRLTATNAAGSATVEKKVEIVKVAPQSAFKIKNNVALVGEKIYLVDQSRYDPTKWMWNVKSDAKTYIVDGQTSSLSIKEPGVYDVTLKTSNEKGSNITTRARAITICNADGQTGLKFDAEDDVVSLGTSPLGDARVSRMTIEWWMYPGVLLEKGCTIGDSKETLLLQTASDGNMTLYVANKSCQSGAGYVIDNEWHHYAVSFNSGTATFYRDGLSISLGKPGTSSVPVLNDFCLGGSEGPMNALIDEFRIWKSLLSQAVIRSKANAPIESPEADENLALYFNFNQQSGDVVDHSAQHLTGKRQNFGPDGDAWSDSKGIFFLNFENTVKDVTSSYLKNYKASFTAGKGFVNGTSRFKKLGSPWIQENSVEADGVTTEFHVDANKGNYLTLALTWDGFADAVKNLKLYQTVELPSGAYELTVERGTWEWSPSGIFMTVAAGSGLPDSDKLDDEALGYALCGQTCSFVITEPLEVSIGLVATTSGKTCHTIKNFVLKQKDYELVKADLDDTVEQLPDEVAASHTLQATGGLGVIRIQVSEPQRVDIFDLGGKRIWGEFVEFGATVPVRRGMYLVGQQKVLVR